MAALRIFALSIVGTTEISANGKDQCKICIEILKDKGALSQTELDSVTVRPVSDELFPDMPPGWECTKGKDAKKPTQSNDAPTLIYRYVTFEKSKKAKMETCRFMACVTLVGDKKFTTHYFKDANQYESAVAITPKLARVLRASDLTLTKALFARDRSWTTIEIYYWALPAGVSIAKENFKDASESNAKFQYFYSNHWDEGTIHNDLNIAFALSKKVNSLTATDFEYRPADVDWVENFKLEGGSDKLRAVRFHRGFPGFARDFILPSYDKTLEWAITDDSGTVSRFFLKARMGTAYTAVLELTDS